MVRYFAPMRSTEDILPEEYLREMCDRYFDPQLYETGGARTSYKKELFYLLNNEVNLCLDCYNKKNKKNYTLVEIVKLNGWDFIRFITFTARDDAGTDGLCYIRGVVHASNEVLLCEIKENGEVGVEKPPGHDDDYDYFSPENQLARQILFEDPFEGYSKGSSYEEEGGSAKEEGGGS